MPDSPETRWRVELRRGAQARTLSRRVWECHRVVFDDAPEFEAWFTGTFDRHARRPDHRLALAVDVDEVIGFAWGYVGQRGQYWADLAASALPPGLAAEWLGGHFEVVELGVLPTLRGQGIGRALLDTLMDGVERRSLLSTTDDDADDAVRLYLRSGWRRLGELSPGVQIMGLDPR